jgi:lipopolysaccharide/colanic/teichoic acid biosynthesis glycosyltransferase
MLSALFWFSTAAILHHHAVYPLSLRLLSRKREPAPPAADLPQVTIIVPAYEEEALIAAKIKNLAAIDYPPPLLAVEIHGDGCTDRTCLLAEKAILAADTSHRFTVFDHTENRGKIALLNEAVANARTPVIILSDASACFKPDAVKALVRHFADEKIAAAGGVYDCKANGSQGEQHYWRYQNSLRISEASLDSALGLSGALYAFRRELFTALPADTINDDFIIPMRMALMGKRIKLDDQVTVTEIERTAPGQEWARRTRIGAGNIQQVLRLPGLANPMRPALAYCFVSGKALRSIMAFLMAAAFLFNIPLASGSLFYSLTLFTQILAYLAAAGALLFPAERRRAPFAQAAALVSGHLANGVGVVRYLRGVHSGKWSRASHGASERGLYGSPSVRMAKRLFDILSGSLLYMIFLLILLPMAMAIKLDSKGPIFYRQLRVGKQLSDRTDLFHLIKFRTMRTDAEAAGAVWASKSDPRVTRLGRFMRKTRLDELPQAMNVLRGEMSMIGPRPERPQFFMKLEGSIPLYIERTHGILPGITGLAQVRQGYDETIEDVRSKVAWDHAYAMRIDTFWSWLKTDIAIARDTVAVMLGRRGQ